MRIKTFTSPHTESLYNDKDVEGLKLKLKNEKTRVLAALLDGMEAKHSKTGPAPAPVLAMASLYKEARLKNPALPHIRDVWVAADALLTVHQEFRVDGMVAPDAKKPAKNKGNVSFAKMDLVQKFGKDEIAKNLEALAMPQLRRGKAHRGPKEVAYEPESRDVREDTIALRMPMPTRSR